MSDRGYQDPSKVSDAKALQLLFKSNTGAKGQSNIPKKRAGQYSKLCFILLRLGKAQS